MLKRLGIIVLCAICALFLTACGGPQTGTHGVWDRSNWDQTSWQ